MRWVLFRTDDGGDDRTKQDAERVAALISEADDATRQLLQLVARATLKDEPLRLQDLADELGQEAGDVQVAIRGLNRDALGDGRPIMELRNEVGVGVHGRTGTIAHVSMRPDLATIVRKARGAAGGTAT